MSMQFVNEVALLTKERKICYETKQGFELSSDDVLVNIAYCGICGSDLPRYFNGKVHFFPLTLGHEFSAIVVAIGNKVSNFEVGDHVVGVPLKPCFKCSACDQGLFGQCKNYSFIGSREPGALQKYLIVKEKNLIKVDKKLSLLEAAFVEPVSVAIHAAKKTIPRENKNSPILIYGFGNIGIVLYQYLKWKGYKNITVVNRSCKKSIIAKELGVNEYILEQDFKNSTLEFKYIFDCTPNNKALDIFLSHCLPEAVINIIGSKQESVVIEQSTFNRIQRLEVLVTGSWMSYSTPFPGEEWLEAIQGLQIGKITVGEEICGGVYKFSEIDKAFNAMKDTNKKTVISIND